MDVTYEQQKKFEPFYGREQELDSIRQLMQYDGPRIVHIYGPGGIGKTALIQKYCQDDSASDFFQLQLTDDDHVIVNTSSQSISIDHLHHFMNNCASCCENVVFVIDPFEPWKKHFQRLVSFSLPRLAPSVRILSASRFPLEQSWPKYADGKQSIYNLELKPLDQTASYRFAESLGIRSFETLHNITKFCRGFPFAIQHISQDTLLEGDEVIGSRLYKVKFYHEAVKFLLKNVKLSHAQSKLLDAASMLWSFDYDLITHLLQCDVNIHVFRTFCELPFIKLTPEGWQVLNSIRPWIRKDFNFRSPELHTAYLHKARSYLLKRLHQKKPNERSSIYLQLLHLIDHDILHSYCFLESFDEFDIRPVLKDELPTVKMMFTRFHHSVPGFFPDLTMQEDYLEEYFDLSPDTFYGFYNKKRLILFVSALPLTRRIRKELINNPTYSRYIKHSAYQENEIIMWIASFQPEFGASAVGLAFMFGYSKIAPNSLMTVITPFPEAHQLMESMGYQRLSWGDYVSEDGVVYKAYQLDLREGLLSERLLTSREANSPVLSPSQPEMIEQTKHLLIHFHNFEENQNFVSGYPYLRKYIHSKHELSEAANQLRKLILSIVEEWCDANGQNAAYGTILRLSYIQNSGNHETIAQRMNMALSTYYRNLKKAVTKMSDAITVFYYNK